MREREAAMELNPEVVRRYAARFIRRSDLYPVQQPGGHYISVKQPLLLSLIAEHLRGSVTLGAYALNAQSNAHWLCFDADDGAAWSQLWRMAGLLSAEGIAPYLELSRRGGHLWLFTAPLSGAEARQFGKQLLREYDLPETLELYPKQNQLTSGPGSLVRLPLGVHRKSGKRYPFVTLAGTPLVATIREQAAVLGNPTRVPDAFVQRVLARAPAPAIPTATPPFRKLSEVGAPSASAWIKSRIAVLEYVSWFVALDNRGRGHCPLHDDQHQSFGVNAQGNYWHCFAGCGGGSVIDFAMKWRERQGLDGSFSATVKALRHELE